MAVPLSEDAWWSYRLEPASFGRRATAALIDVALILTAVTLYYWFFRGFDALVQAYRNEVMRATLPPGLFERTMVKIVALSMLAHLLYGMLTEQSPWSGTFGKFIVGIRVVDEYGERLTITASTVRNLVKFASLAALGVGFLSVLWRPGRQAWHDRAAGSFVARG
jgi:uncharacterized RDD family membrane protein YckC